MIHHTLQTPVDGFLLKKYLYDMDATREGHVRARVVGISTYPGHAPALSIIVTEPGDGEGSVFTYLPLDCFTANPRGKTFPYASLAYHDCRDGRVDFSVLSSLPKKVRAFLRTENLWLGGTYLGTLDWFDGNDLLNILLLENGQLAALPFHKLKFGETAPQKFEHYRKLRAEWKVEGELRRA